MLNPLAFYKMAIGYIVNLDNKRPLVRRFYSIAGYVVCIAFTEEKVLPVMTPALEHLAIEAREKWDFLIYVADHESVGTPLKMLKGYESSVQSRGEILALSKFPDLITSYNHHDGALNLVHLTENTAVYWIRSLRHLPWWVAGSPLQRIIGCWMRYQGIELTHAAAVGNRSGGVLLAGKSGSGKSTTTLTCIEAGDLSYVSEDYCLVDHDRVYSLYNSSKLEPHTIDKFPHLKPHIVNKARQPWEKGLIFQHRIAPRRVLHSFPLKAIVVLNVGEHTLMRPCRPIEASIALSASTICQLTAAYRPTLTHYANLLKKIPCYRLTLGPEPHLITENIQRIITEASS